MKKRLIVIMLIFVVVAGAVWFFIFRESGRYEVMQGVPDDAVFVVETSSFNDIHNKLRKNQIWESLKVYPSFEKYHANLNYADSICNAHQALKRLITDRPFAVSCHLQSSVSFDFLYICDLGKLNVIQTMEGIIAAIVKDGKTRIIRKGPVTELVSGDIKLYYAIKSNLLLASFSEKLVRNSVETCGSIQLPKQQLPLGDLVLNLNHHGLDQWVDVMLGNGGNSDTSFLKTTRLVLSLTNKSLDFEGVTEPDRKKFSVLSALNLLDGTSSEVQNIAANNTAAYLSLCFSSFMELKAILLENYKSSNLREYREYEQTLNRLNKFLGLDVAEVFTSWMGNEIAIIKPAVDGEKRMDNLMVAIRSKDIDLAKDQMGYLMEQIGRRTPVRFKALEYNGHTINYLSMKGFFNVFFGTFFKKFDRPYFTFIEDYVVFSNSSATLATMIKDYSLGNTLAHDVKHEELTHLLGKRNCIYGYVNSPVAYEYIYRSMKPETRAEFVKNRGAFQSFESIGFALSNAETGFKTRLIARHNVNAPEEYEIREFSRELEELADRIESGYYLPVIPDSIAVSLQEAYTYRTDNFDCSGQLSDGEPVGVWNVSDKQGIMIAQTPYSEGKPYGESHYFFLGGKIRARIIYDDGEIESYKDFFPDGTLKTELEYKKGVRNGVAKFYYSTGHLLCDGKYKKGQRTGVWKYYRVTGETERKIKF